MDTITTLARPIALPSECRPYPRWMELSSLVEACREEIGHFRRDHTGAGDFGLELFRRAICERDEAAWAAVDELYRGLVRSWVQRHPALRSAGQDADYWVSSAFARFWSAMRPERFEQFPRLGAVLRFLQMCTHSALVDEVRDQQRSRRVAESVGGEAEAFPAEQVAPGVDALEAEREERHEVWRAVARALPDERARTVVYLSFACDLPPRTIHARHPALFASVADVYRVKREALERLGRNPAVRQLLTP
jgi:DNA-directed RNA polymerase specialized sigma24 family protein